MNKVCKFCNNEISNKVEVCNFIHRKNKGEFYECKLCDIEINYKKFSNLYDNQDSSNYNLKKNIFFYLKKITFFIFFFKIRKYLKKKEKILDYGCGSAELALSAKTLFPLKKIYTADVYRLDEKINLGIEKHFSISNNELRGEKFDIIILRHVFEHLDNLDNFLYEIKQNLEKNGNLIIEVPNKKSFWKEIMSDRWPGYFYPYHIYVFSDKFLKNIFKRNNLEILDIKKLEPPIFGTFFFNI